MIVSEALKDSMVAQTIETILKRGNTVELKKERDKLVIVEISRQAKVKIETTKG